MKDKKKTYPSAVSIRNRRLFILDCFLRGFSQSFAPNDPHLGRFSVEKKKKSSFWTLLNFFFTKIRKINFSCSNYSDSFFTTQSFYCQEDSFNIFIYINKHGYKYLSKYHHVTSIKYLAFTKFLQFVKGLRTSKSS